MKEKINISKLIIRPCTEKDIDSIYDIHNQVIDYLKEEEKGYFLPFKKEFFKNVVTSPASNGEIYGAFLDEKMIAWLFLSVANRMTELKKMLPEINGTCADIDGVIVLPKYRGNNIQNILVTYAEKQAKLKGIENIIAEVTFGNEYSLRNLKKLGYEVKTWYKKDENIKRNILLKELKDE